MAGPAGIPCIDIGDPGQAAPEVARACAELGFFCVTNHGVDRRVLAEAWVAARAFFDLTLEQKMQAAMPEPGYPYGYSPLAGEALARSTGDASPPDRKETFSSGPVDRPLAGIGGRSLADGNFLYAPNVWPAGLPALRRSWVPRFRAMSGLAERLLEIMALALALPPGHFRPMSDNPVCAMRALNYPAAGRNPQAGAIGAGAHTDYGTLTILEVGPDQPGLEVMVGGRWMEVTAPAGVLVVNLGDAMARWTNDRWRSTLHRVRLPHVRRQAIAFFHNPNWDATIECIPTCLAPGEQPRYEPVTAGPYLLEKFRSALTGS
jgi:isopenicillin N synthase-like dioxygenase